MARFIPLSIFVLLVGLLWKTLHTDPMEVPSARIGSRSPAFRLSTVEDPNRFVTESVLEGNVTVLHVWSSWCTTCRDTHQLWMEFSRQPSLRLIGLNYFDTLGDAQEWLSSQGNPFEFTLFDSKGDLGLDYGIQGTPETFIIDKKGVVRYRHKGPMDRSEWQEKVYPFVQRLDQES